jgi:hypothetical protein
LGTECIWTGGNESKRQLEEHAMKFLFEDDTFSFETLRTTGFANSFGADLGEVLATARQVTDGDQASWHRAWKATAARVAELGERSLAAGHRVTARENLLRASNYYRTAAARTPTPSMCLPT